MWWIQFPISYCIVREDEKWKYHYFYFLCRYFFNFEWFPWGFDRPLFFQYGRKCGYSISALKRIWHDGCDTHNPFIETIISKQWVILYRLRSHRRDMDERTVCINSQTVLSSIHSLPDFKLLCFVIIASRPSKACEADIKKMERHKSNALYAKLVRSRTLTTIGVEFGKSKSATSKLLNRADEKFSFFTISARYMTFHGKIARISNIYSVRGISYHFHRKDTILTQRSENTIWYEAGIRTIEPRALRKKTFVYGRKIEWWKKNVIGKEIFLDREAYSYAYLTMIWE
jgi:hypothetical protein